MTTDEIWVDTCITCFAAWETFGDQAVPNAQPLDSEGDAAAWRNKQKQRKVDTCVGSRDPRPSMDVLVRRSPLAPPPGRKHI